MHSERRVLNFHKRILIRFQFFFPKLTRNKYVITYIYSSKSRIAVRKAVLFHETCHFFFQKNYFMNS